MIYKQFQDLKLSALGLGCMRLPTIDGQDSNIDEEKAAQLVAHAMDRGVNYYDTAWGYHAGNSETVMGKILSKYPRESFYLASKFPGFAPENMAKKEEIFERQLEKCQTEYFDFYLFHNVAEKNIDYFMSPAYDLHGYLAEQKRQGRIRHLGFSTHGSLATIRRFLDAYRDDLEFCQIQLNWLDWDLQNAKAKVELIRSYGIPVWVMEPVRGGRLAALNDTHAAKLEALRPGVTAPEWAFRFLQSIDGIGMILSGMSNDQQVFENIETFSEEKPLNKAEWDVLQDIAREMIAANAVPCTACRYCVERCPQALDIPAIIKAYNEKETWAAAPGPQKCIGCESCMLVCPQGIHIPKIMDKFR